MTHRTWGAVVLAACLLAGVPLSGARLAHAARGTQADFEAGRALLEMQDRYARARAFYNNQRYDAAIVELDYILPRLNYALENTPDKRIRNALGTLLSRSGSLRLASAKKRDEILAAEKAAKAAEEAKRAEAEKAAKAAEEAAEAKDAETQSMDATMRLADTTLVASAPEPELAPAEADAAKEETKDEAKEPGEDDGDAFDLPAVEEDPNAIEVEEHPRVSQWLDYFTGRGRGTFERWLERSGLYMGWMKRVLEREGVPTDLVHLVFVESGFNPQAKSYASAVGPWQFIRGTAKMFGLKVNSYVDERKDPEASTVAAARYLKHLNGLFNSWPLALASYNAGEQTVINAIKRQGTRDFWSLRLPRETRDYVPKFMAVVAIARDPKRYGFDEVSISAPMTYDEVSLPAPVDLRALATACQVDVEEIQRLNPAILKYAAPGVGEEITLRVPEGSGEKLRASLEDGSLQLPKIELPPDPVVLRHKVRRGESLKALSLRYGVPASKIAHYNRIGRKSRLKVGRTVLIPMHDSAAPSARASSAAKAPATEADSATVRTIKVKRGQTLSGLAAKHGTTVAELRALNGMGKKSSVKAGQRLKVPAEG